MVTCASSVASKYAQAVCFVHHDAGVVLLLQLHDFRKFCQVAFHGEKAVRDNQFDGVGVATHQLAFQVLHVVVLIPQKFRE